MHLVPARLTPPAKRLNRIAFIAAFVRNPLLVVPRAAYEEDFVAVLRGGTPFAWATSPALIKTVLLDEREKFQKRSQIRLLSPLLGKGILTSEGAHWKWQRQASAPMFRREDLLGFVPTFVRASENLVAKWRASPEATRPIDRDMSAATFEVISATLLPSADHTVGPAAECARVAVTAHEVLGLRDLSRSDLIIDADGAIWFLEVNVAPGLTETSTVPLSVQAAGLDLGDLMADLVRAATSRGEA